MTDGTKRLLLAFLPAALLAGCAMPQSATRTLYTRPSLAIQGAPAGALLFVDGQPLGDANVFNGQPNVVRVEPGTHEIELRDGGGRVIYRQRAFVESEIKTIQVH